MNKVIEGDNQFCGPAALSIISGRPVDYCARTIGDLIGKAPDKVKGVFVADLLKAAKKLRINTEKVSLVSSSVYSLVSQLAREAKVGTYLVVIPKHYIVIEVSSSQVYICDNHTKQPINLAGSARLNSRVEECYKVSVRPAAVHVRDLVEVIEVKNSSDSAFYINIKSEYEDPQDNTTCSKGLFRADRQHLKQIAEKLNQLVSNPVGK